MITAKAKKEENIAEYLIYMWQIEDIIRAYDFDIERINDNIISKYNTSDTQKSEIREWYESLIEMMRLENVKSSGHIQINNNTLINLTDLHIELLKSPKFPEYSAEFYRTLPFIVELRSKAGDNKLGEIETCFDALYGLLMLRLQNKEVSSETERAMTQISKFIATLAKYYKKDKEKPLFDNDDK